MKRLWRQLTFILTTALVFSLDIGSAAPRTSNWDTELKAAVTIPDDQIGTYINVTSGELNTGSTGELIQRLMGRFITPAGIVTPICPGGQVCSAFPRPSDYFIIHVIKFSDPDTKKRQVPEKEYWYVFNSSPNWDDDDFSTRNRVYGQKIVWFLPLYINVDKTNSFKSVEFTFRSTKRVPAYLLHLTQIASLLQAPAAAGAGGIFKIFFDYHQFSSLTPADLEISGKVQFLSPGADPYSIDGKKFDNEGKYHLDFTLGLPIKKFSELKYGESSNTLVPVKVDREKLFGFVNYYFMPIDVKSSGFTWIPHLVTGLGLGAKPLQKAFFGVGYGPVLANFYAGVLLNTKRLPQTTSCGSTPTGDQLTGPMMNKHCPEFSVGINLSVGSVIESLKKK